MLAVGGLTSGHALAMQQTVKVGVDVDAGTLDPRLTRDTTAYRVTNLIYAGLVHSAPGLEAEPDLAESWEIPEPTAWIFQLRDGLKFPDGTPLTADDVVYTFAPSSTPISVRRIVPCTPRSPRSRRSIRRP